MLDLVEFFPDFSLSTMGSILKDVTSLAACTWHAALWSWIAQKIFSWICLSNSGNFINLKLFDSFGPKHVSIISVVPASYLPYLKYSLPLMLGIPLKHGRYVIAEVWMMLCVAQGRSLNLNYTNYSDLVRRETLSSKEKIPMVNPGIEPETSWLICRLSMSQLLKSFDRPLMRVSLSNQILVTLIFY